MADDGNIDEPEISVIGIHVAFKVVFIVLIFNVDNPLGVIQNRFISQKIFRRFVKIYLEIFLRYFEKKLRTSRKIFRQFLKHDICRKAYYLLVRDAYVQHLFTCCS